MKARNSFLAFYHLNLNYLRLYKTHQGHISLDQNLQLLADNR
jgi:hypothetical protein